MDQVSSKKLDKIKNDLNTALKKGQKVDVSILRLLLSDINYQQIENKDKLSDKDIEKVIKSRVKKLREAIELYKKAKRNDLVHKEEAELHALSQYLPAQIAQQEIEKLVDEVIAQIKPSGPQDFGKVMSQVMAQAEGKADGKLVSDTVRKKLSS